MSNSYVRVWVEGGEIPFVNSNSNEITFDVVTVEGADVYDFNVSGPHMDSEAIREQLSLSGGNLLTGNLAVSNFTKRS
jgi:hypothetical protein